MQDIPHLRERGAKHEEIGILHSTERIAGGMVHDAQPVAFGDAGAAAHETIHFFRQTALFDGQSQRAAQQTDPGERDFVEVHEAIKPGGRAIGNKQRATGGEDRPDERWIKST